jgi:triacylglycerol lipase
VILLHGFLSSSQVMLPLERHLRRTLRRPIVRVALGARLPLHLRDVRKSAQRVHEVVEALARMPGFEFADVVGHSLGGLVATYLLKRLDRGRHVRRVVTLGAPHGGTPAALLGVLLFGLVSRAVWQMLPRSPLVRELEATAVPEGCEIVALASPTDRVVPVHYAGVATTSGQHTLHVPAARHVELLFATPVLGLVAELLHAA